MLSIARRVFGLARNGHILHRCDMCFKRCTQCTRCTGNEMHSCSLRVPISLTLSFVVRSVSNYWCVQCYSFAVYFFVLNANGSVFTFVAGERNVFGGRSSSLGSRTAAESRCVLYARERSLEQLRPKQPKISQKNKRRINIFCAARH